MTSKLMDQVAGGTPGLSSAPPAVELPLDAIPVPDLVDEAPLPANEHSVLGLTELLLKNPGRLDVLTRDPSRQPELIPRFLAVSLASFSLFSLTLVLLLRSAPLEAVPSFLRETWTGHSVGSAVSLWLAYTLGLGAATGICLPSFYFYGLLSGVQISVLQVTAQIMKGKAATSVFLMGLL